MQTSQRHAGCKRRPYIWLVLGLWASTAAAERLPLWEVGVGAGALRIPDYRGAAETHDYPFPFIYPAYRGRVFKVDETGVHGMLLESDRLKLDVSLDGAVPVKSDANGVRAGMPDLDPTLQFGPALKVKLWEAAPARQSLILNLPLRAVFAIDSSGVDHIGYTASPHLTYYRRVDVAGQPWKLGLSGGLEFGSYPRLLLPGRARVYDRHAPGLRRRQRLCRHAFRPHAHAPRRGQVDERIRALRPRGRGGVRGQSLGAEKRRAYRRIRDHLVRRALAGDGRGATLGN